MNGLQEIQDELFLDIQNIIEELTEISSIDELLQKEKLIKELSEKATFLKLSEAFGLNNLVSKSNTAVPIVLSAETETVFEDEKLEEPELEEVIDDGDLDLNDNQILAEAHQEELLEEEEEKLVDEDELENDQLDLYDNEMLKDDDTEHHEEHIDSQIEESASFLNNESQFSFALDNSAEEQKVEEPSLISEIFVSEEESDVDNIEEIKAENKDESEVVEEEPSQDLEENTEVAEPQEEIAARIEEKLHDSIFESDEANANAKKIKLANIKGIGKTLFDDDPLEKIISTDSPTLETKITGSLSKSNMPTDYMEAPKPKPEFRLDLNDKIAFSQHLFKNSQVELNQVVHKLNEFDNIDDAKEFLSDMYYLRNWEKADSYAQRLWTLVENRFL